MKVKNRLDNIDKQIIHFLGNRGNANTNEISENLKISWATANKHLRKLNIKGYVIKEKQGELIIWSLNY